MSALHPVFHTRLCDLLGIDYPILQSGMGGIAGPDLAATIQEARTLLLERFPQTVKLDQ